MEYEAPEWLTVELVEAMETGRFQIIR